MTEKVPDFSTKSEWTEIEVLIASSNARANRVLKDCLEELAITSMKIFKKVGKQKYKKMAENALSLSRKFKQ